MGIFDTQRLKAHANKFLVLAQEEHEKGNIAFAQQLRVRARKYLDEVARIDACSNRQTPDAE